MNISTLSECNFSLPEQISSCAYYHFTLYKHYPGMAQKLIKIKIQNTMTYKRNVTVISQRIMSQTFEKLDLPDSHLNTLCVQRLNNL